ncbi:MAG TPA: acyl-CoA dehydrogenase family protein [Acidimicrobiales bacterium]|nr:acyl-CoA dehydrogenase family protein [Acidimicrobiales bacterium]
MDFELSEDEAALAEAIRSLCAGRFPLDRLRAAEGPGRHIDTAAWGELADAGVFSLQVPEVAGGVGLGMAAASVVFEELGRALVPGPILSTHLAAGTIDGAAEGKTVVGSVRRPATSGAEAFVPTLVGHLSSLGVLILVGDDGLTAVDPTELDAVALGRSLDPLTPLWRIDHLPDGRPVGGVEEARTWRRAQWVLGGALLVGLAAGTLDMAVAYAKQREQFGKPIGSFQAVKHMCADMLVASETARSAVHAAAVTIDQPGVGDPERAAAGAGLLAAEAAIKNGKTSIQVHGGMGFTWEVPAHLYLMRARVLAQSIGPVDDLAELVAELY